MAVTDPIAELSRAGRLAADYPAVRGLLAGLDEPGLDRAGRLLARVDPDEVLRAHPGLPAVTIAITGHGTLGTLVAPLTAELARHGLLLRPWTGQYDGYVLELADTASGLYEADPDLTVCLLDPTVIFDEVPSPWRVEDVERVLDARLTTLEELAARFGEHARGTLVLNTLPLPSSYPAQLLDLRSRARLGVVWREAAARLLRLAETRLNVVVVDLDPLLAEGIPAVDARLAAYARLQLSPALLARYAREIGHLARLVTGRAAKCLVVDLDQTLWGGVLGDDGVEGIEVGEGYRGETFAAFQRVVAQIGAQGVLLAAVSKNDPEPVAAALADHPGMVLREGDFTRIVANWRPKHDNLTELAKDLGLGVDSLVFVDDSPFECGLVRRELPGVAVVQVDTEPALHTPRLLADGWFTVRELTAEDRARTEKYREDLARKDFLDTFTSLEAYLEQLGVWVRAARAQDADVARLSQLTLRTNQFNLTTRRLQPADVRALLADPAATVVTLRSGDRFGDNGLVGAVLLHREGTALRIENFLLSCRVFGRGVEAAGLSAVLRHARDSGAATVRGLYRPSAKNGKVAEFYTRHGFTRAGESGEGAEYVHDLTAPADPPGHLDLRDELSDSPSLSADISGGDLP
ncbi:HAD-IIIC family phosphatase [Actinocorallia sp. API 0066]|uniref:HAD-IIIC family phosphatase n=1 Tax=Actinocorallia sp. API 0066 TaxID=2896846 RepID=UPI001E5822B2|nr:HAD-IIIC family phosphatase [Actinocorallia sp. API 0066]MCD0451749.1 HAD-IIIC family phosphatase [Actinocorallia sp. API 0066]